MVAIAKKRAARPIIIFVGKDFRKSSSAKRDVRIPRNVNVAVVEEKSDIASEIINSINNFSWLNVGKPVSPFPPGIVITAANIMVIIRAPTTV
ncbi:hypothetical protein ACFX13_024928 [Malus domestica]